MKKSAARLEFRGIELNVNWVAGQGTPVNELPACAGVYAEIYWPELGVRIGETGISIRGKIRHDIRWFESMRDGTAAPNQLRRTLPIAMAAKKSGSNGFEFYVVSTDPRLLNKDIRQECERFLFKWLEGQIEYISWNRQKSWR